MGGVAEAVTVSADTALLNKANPEIGTSMASDIVTNLPLNFAGGRSLENFAYAIAPSVEGNNWTSNINGGAPFTKEVVLDGTSAVIQIGGHIGESSPPMEAVEEFTVQTSGIPAEYGRTAGGVFNFSLKSGTNQIRGSAYGYLRNEALNANTWQNNYLAATDPENADEYERAKDRQYLGGASLGGPIIKDKTFFYVAVEEYQQTRFLLGGLTQTVPTERMLNGDFGQLLNTGAAPLGTDAGGNPIYPGAILDPAHRPRLPRQRHPRESHQQHVAADRRHLPAGIPAPGRPDRQQLGPHLLQRPRLQAAPDQPQADPPLLQHEPARRLVHLDPAPAHARRPGRDLGPQRRRQDGRPPLQGTPAGRGHPPGAPQPQLDRSPRA